MSKLEYYRIFQGDEDFVPLVSADERFLAKKKMVGTSHKLNLRLINPIPGTPNINVDYLSESRTIVSDKIASKLETLSIAGVELIPAVIHMGGVEHSGFWGLHIYNLIKCIDVESSDVKMDSAGILSVNKLVLDNQVLEEIPLEERLVFRLVEDSVYEFYHKSIVELMISVNPQNIRFVKVEDLNNRTS